MRDRRTAVEGTLDRVGLVVRMTALVMALALPQTVYADPFKPPPVPVAISVAASEKAFFAGHAVGTQNYSCLPSGGGFAWTLFGPQATLFDEHGRQLTTHFLSPNPDEGGTLRATWQHSRDTSSVWAMATGTSTDAAFVKPGAIPWLLLKVVGKEDGPVGHQHTLTSSTSIHRLNTSGGSAPATGCASLADVGKRIFVPYEADYFFYQMKKKHGHDDD